MSNDLYSYFINKCGINYVELTFYLFKEYYEYRFDESENSIA